MLTLSQETPINFLTKNNYLFLFVTILRMEILFNFKSQKSKVKNQKCYLISSIFFSLFSFLSYSQEKVKDTTKVNQLDEVLVSAIRVTTKTPVSFSNLDKKEIKIGRAHV